MKMDSTSRVSAELSTEVVIKNAGVWTEMEARLKDWKSVVSIQNNPDQTLSSYFHLNSKNLQKVYSIYSKCLTFTSTLDE